MSVLSADPADGPRFVEYLQRREREAWRAGVGLAQEHRLEDLVARYRDLFTADRIAAEQAAVVTAADETSSLRAHRRLLARGVGWVEAETVAFHDRVANDEFGARVTVDGREFSYRSVEGLLRNARSPSARRRLARAREAATWPRVPLLRDLWEARYDAVLRLGYPSYAQAYGTWKQLDLDRLVAIADQVLAATPSCAEVLPDAIVAAGVELDGPFTAADVPALLRGPAWDPWFPTSSLEPVLHSTAAELGVDLAALPNVHIDLAEREAKTPRPFCAAVRVPEEIRLVARPAGGHRDYEEVLHEAGHAIHYAFTDPERPWELRYLVDDSVAEVHAYLMASLLRHPFFLVDHLALPTADAERFSRHATALELFMVRRYCGKVRFSVALHRSHDLDGAADAYEEELRRAVGVHVPGGLALSDLDPGLYAEQYLTAWVVEAQVRSVLVATFGPRWWAQAEAGEILRALWQSCGAQTPESLLEAVGVSKGLDPVPLVESLTIR